MKMDYCSFLIIQDFFFWESCVLQQIPAHKMSLLEFFAFYKTKEKKVGENSFALR